MAQQLNKVFVYGTLKSGDTCRGMDRISPEAMIVGKAVTTYPDYDMIDLGAFPGAIDGTKYIEGEVWEVDENTFHVLDQIEGFPDFYSRKLVNTTQGKAWMYYLPNTEYTHSSNSEDSPRIDMHNQTLIWSNK